DLLIAAALDPRQPIAGALALAHTQLVTELDSVIPRHHLHRQAGRIVQAFERVVGALALLEVARGAAHDLPELLLRHGLAPAHEARRHRHLMPRQFLGETWPGHAARILPQDGVDLLGAGAHEKAARRHEDQLQLHTVAEVHRRFRRHVTIPRPRLL